MSKENRVWVNENSWSDPASNLSGRIQVQLEDLHPGLRHAVYLELKNHSPDVIAVANQPQIHAELFDLSGKEVDTSGISANGPKPVLQWAMIPYNAYIGFRIDMLSAGVPTREHGEILLALGGQNWRLKIGQYVLHVAVEFNKEKDGPSNQWNGKLVLPPAAIEVREEMLISQ